MTRTLTRRQAGGRRDAAFISVRESFTGSPGLRVDREAGVIYRVKVLGKQSPNTHGKPGVRGTDYLTSAHQSLVGIIESAQGGLKVNKDHTERNNPNRDRRVNERFGWLLNPILDGNETYADLHLLKSDPESAKLFEAAERNPHCFALSINADGHYGIVGGRLKIDRFQRVFSVDVVADGGSTVSLAESKRTKGQAMTLQESLTATKLSAANIARVFEMDSLLKPDMAVEDAAATAPVDEGYEAHLGKAVVAILNDETLDQEAKKKKILAILKLTGEEEESPGTIDAAEKEMPVEESDEEGGKEEDDDEKKKAKAKESRDHVAALMAELDYKPAKEASVAITESLCRLDTDLARIQLIKALKAGGSGDAKGKGTGPPRSSNGVTRTQESFAAPKDAASQAALLLRSS